MYLGCSSACIMPVDALRASTGFAWACSTCKDCRWGCWWDRLANQGPEILAVFNILEGKFVLSLCLRQCDQTHTNPMGFSLLSKKEILPLPPPPPGCNLFGPSPIRETLSLRLAFPTPWLTHYHWLAALLPDQYRRPCTHLEWWWRCCCVPCSHLHCACHPILDPNEVPDHIPCLLPVLSRDEICSLKPDGWPTLMGSN